MISASDFSRFKTEPLVVVTAYDAAFSRIAEDAGVDAILVGDSLANVLLGQKSTRAADMRVMELFVAAAAAGAADTHVIADMPFDAAPEEDTALLNAEKFIALGAHSVKIEGYRKGLISRLVRSGIPVVGHAGLLPQTASSFGQVGRSENEQADIFRSAQSIADEGAFAIVLEHMPAGLAADITARLGIPTIGIGAGSGTNGQVLVLHDVLGIIPGKKPPFVKQFADVYGASVQGIADYAAAVRERRFPGPPSP